MVDELPIQTGLLVKTSFPSDEYAAIVSVQLSQRNPKGHVDVWVPWNTNSMQPKKGPSRYFREYPLVPSPELAWKDKLTPIDNPLAEISQLEEQLKSLTKADPPSARERLKRSIGFIGEYVRVKQDHFLGNDSFYDCVLDHLGISHR